MPASAETTEFARYDEAFNQVQAPAIGLIITGIFNLISIPIFLILTLAFIHGRRGGPNLLLVLILFVVGVVNILAGLRMKRLESRGLSLLGSVLAIITPPGFFIGLFAGIWSLAVLTRATVREFFGKSPPPQPAEYIAPKRSGIAWKVVPLVAVAVLVFLLFFIVAGIFAFVGVRKQQSANAQAEYEQMQANEKRALEDRRRAQDEAAASWSPTMPPDGKFDPMTVLQEAKELTERGDYQKALVRYLWYYHHALEYNSGLSGVRLSFALSDWVELGRRYPEARQALVDIRDTETKDFDEHKGYFAKFQEVASINQYLNEDDATDTLFQNVRNSGDQQLAEQCFFVVEPLLVKRGDYAMCMDYIPDPKAAFARMRDNWEHLKGFEDHMAEMNQRTQKQMEDNNEKLRKEHPEWSLPATPNRFAPPKTADNTFVSQTRQLIEILVAVDRKDTAREIREDALAALYDVRLKTAISDAEKKLGQPVSPDTAPSLESQPPVAVETDPPSGATDVTPGEHDITVRFSKEMTDGSWSWSSAWNNSIVALSTTPHYDADHKTCSMQVTLEPGKTYAYWLNTQTFHGFRDTAGIPAVPYLLIFQTRATNAP